MADVWIGPPPHRGILGPGSGSGMRIVVLLGMVLRALPSVPRDATIETGRDRPLGSADITPTLRLTFELDEGDTMGLQGFSNRVEIDRWEVG
jgi:hypothetical protein